MAPTMKETVPVTYFTTYPSPFHETRISTLRAVAFRGMIIAGALLATLPAMADAKPPLTSDLYASSAIRAGDYATAEQQLDNRSYVDSNDPGRLINLARVYAATNRIVAARKALLHVQVLPDVKVTLASGKTWWSTDLARKMMSSLRSTVN
jgi:hypothetical protein